MKEKSRMHLRSIEAYNDLRKRSTARYAEYESQLRNQLQGVTEELHTSRQAVAEKTDELNQLRVKRLSYMGTTMREVTTHLHRVSVLPS